MNIIDWIIIDQLKGLVYPLVLASQGNMLNEDCYCCNQVKFKIKRAPFPKNAGSYVAVAEPFWRMFIDGFGGK